MSESVDLEKLMEDVGAALQRAEQFSRQADLVPIHEVAEWSVLVVGAGGIGSGIAKECLPGYGFGKMTICDPDEVGIENVAPGSFTMDDIGAYKAENCAEHAANKNPLMDVEHVNDVFDADALKGRHFTVVIVGLDSLDARRGVYEAIMRGDITCDLYIDPRMGGAGCLTYAIDMRKPYKGTRKQKLYERALYHVTPKEQVCGTKATVFISNGTMRHMIGRAIMLFTHGHAVPIYQRYELTHPKPLSEMFVDD